LQFNPLPVQIQRRRCSSICGRDVIHHLKRQKATSRGCDRWQEEEPQPKKKLFKNI